jgi:hypothetical protein
MSFVERENLLSEEADHIQKMLESASETLIELRRIRLENRQLEDRLRNLQSRLEQRLNDESKEKQRNDRALLDDRELELLESELTDLFLLLLSAPEFKLDAMKNLTFNHTIASVACHSMPATVQTVIHYLQNLPVPFKIQKLGIKREIIQAMVQARIICGKLMEDIHQLEISRYGVIARRRINGEVEAKATQLRLLCQEMGRFTLD